MSQATIQAIAMACGAIAYTPPPLRAVRGVSMTFGQLDAFAERIANPLLVELAGHESSILHLSAMVDGLRQLLVRSMAVMKALHESAVPDESTEGVPCVIQAEPFRTFVDAHAELLYEVKQLGEDVVREVPHDR